MNITALSALELSKLIRNREISVIEAVEAQLAMIELRETTCHCYITVTHKEALARAKEVQRQIDSGDLKASVLAGVPLAVKDNICTNGIPTTCGSRILADFIPTYEATVVERLQQAGAVIIGKTNMDEFAMGSTTETSFFGPTLNPWDIRHVPGGSSGGSAAAVAAEETFCALGSDTGGSIRQPASYCGVTGIKPTYGSVSRYGLVAYASSLDQIGPIGRNISDCTAILEAISGHDPRDSTSADIERYQYMDALIDDVKGMRIGIPKGYIGDGLDSEVKEGLRKAIEVFERRGAIVEEFDIEAVEYAVPAYYVIACAEAGSNLSRYDGVKYGYRSPEFEGLLEMYRNTRSEGFGTEARRRMMIGAFVLSSGYYEAFYNKAMKVRAIINQGFKKAFERYDILLGPTAPQVAPRLGESLSDPLKMYLSDIYTVSVNLAGLPAVSLPCSRSKEGLPIGIQLIGRHFGERDLIRAAYCFEQAVCYHRPCMLQVDCKSDMGIDLITTEGKEE